MVEASLLLPLALFFVVAMASAFRFLQLEESVMYHGFDQMNESCVQAAMEPEAEPLTRLMLQRRIVGKVTGEWDENMADHGIVEGLWDWEGISSLVEQEDGRELNCQIRCGWTVGRGTGGGFSDRLRFCGRIYGGEDQETVWIFPNWGQRYHRNQCTVTGGERKRTIRDAAQRLGYTPCLICMKGEENSGEAGLGRR